MKYASLAALPGLFMIAGCNPQRSESTVAVKRDEIVGYVSLKGKVVAPPGEQALTRSPFQTTVKKVHVTLKEKVNKGQLLLELTLPSQDAALQGAQQRLAQAKANLSSARAAAGAPVTAAAQELAAAKAALKAAKAGAAAVKTQTDPATGTTTTITPTGSAELQQAQADVVGAQANYASARAQVDAAVTPSIQEVRAAEADLIAARAGRAQGMIRAPISGTIVALNAQAGATVGTAENKDTPLVWIVDLMALQVQAAMTADQKQFVKEDMPVKLGFPSVQKEVEGKITQMTSRPDESGKTTSYIAIISFDNNEGFGMPDQEATAAVKIGVVNNVVAVPSNAVDLGSDGIAYVQVKRGEDWVKQPVKVGLSDNQYTEIKEGIKEGEQVKATTSLIPGRQ